MNETEATALNPKKDIYDLIGELASNPKFLNEADVLITPNDAVDKFQKMILAALLNLIQKTNYNKKINAIDINKFLVPYKHAYNEWKKNNGVRYFTDAIKSTSQYDIQSTYEMVKKYHYLRIYSDKGIDIRDLLNYQKPNEKQIGHFRKMSIGDVIDHYSNKTDAIKKHFQDTTNNVQSFEIGDGIVKHIQNLTKTSQLGYPFQDGYYNQLFGGMRRNKFMIRSTVTGGGKTRQALKDFCNVAFSYYYDPYANHGRGKWINTGTSLPALFISTELNKAELQNIILAYLTGMESKTISFGKFNSHQKKLLDDAVQIIQQSHFYFEYTDDFDSNDIENIIDKYVRQKGVKYVDFDYIQDSSRLMLELKHSYGNGLRSDQALVYLSKELKRMAEKYHIFIMSATQVNGFYSDDDKEKSRTEYTLRGGKSIADKVDYGIITSRFTKSDKNAFSKNHELNKYHPNYAHHVYKNRSGQKDIIIWTIFNYGNLREKPLVVTDYNYNVIHSIKPLTIQYK